MDAVGLIPDFGSLLVTIAAFVAALSVIVAIHEYGHYIVGRWSGIEADVFSIGMGPIIASRVDRRGTRWQLAAFPVGGYVKFRGDADAASMGRSDAAEGGPTTMAGAPLWARAATVAAGPAFNFVLSILVFAVILAIRGVASDPLVVESVRELPGIEQRIERGDRLLTVAGEEVPPVEDLVGFFDALPMERMLPYAVERDGETLEFEAPYPYPPVVGGVTPQSAAAAAGLREGEVITAVDGTPVFAFSELREIVGQSEGATLALEVWSPDGETREVELTPQRMDLPLAEGGFETRWLIGVTGGLYLAPETVTPGPLSALGYGVGQVVFIIESSLSGLYHMAVGAISSCNLQGPIGIAQTSGAAASAGVLSFVWFIAVLSTAVGFLNLLPIPVLDGGHLVFFAYEAIVGKPPSDRALNVLMAAGLALLGTLMVFAVTNDVFCP
jgi:regulator of sigma E protease